MLKFVRRLFRRKPKPPEPYLDGLLKLALERGKEKLPCCGFYRRAHVTLRSGKMMCPLPSNEKVDLRYNPLEVDEEFEPCWSEPHFPCEKCGCKRGAHRPEGWKRRECLDPDCPGCPTGCHAR